MVCHNNDVKKELYFYLLCKSLLVSKSMIRKGAFIRCFASYLLEDALANFHWVNVYSDYGEIFHHFEKDFVICPRTKTFLSLLILYPSLLVQLLTMNRPYKNIDNFF